MSISKILFLKMLTENKNQTPEIYSTNELMCFVIKIIRLSRCGQDIA